MLCYVLWNLFTVGSIQFSNYSTIASLEANQNRLKDAITKSKMTFDRNLLIGYKTDAK